MKYLLLIAFTTVWSCRTPEEDKKLIKSDPVLTMATITGYTGFHRGSRYLGYKFKVDSVEYRESESIILNTEQEKIILNNDWPLIYYKPDPGFNRLLIFSSRYKVFGLTRPDSLPSVE